MEDITLDKHTNGNKIRTGVRIQLPEGWLAMILPRSSIGAKTPLRLSNSVGLIDSGYRGELGVLYDNTSDKPYDIHAGDRIAQLLVMPSYRFKAQVVDSLEDTDRGTGGFGSTGT
jgi:dUTP pyrophosphatase